MKAILISQTGDPAVLQLTESDTRPSPGPGQVLMKIHAAGVNFVDVYHRRGRYPQSLPFVPGLEASGVVEQLGDNAGAWKIGDRVCYTGHLGSYSEYTAIDASKLIALPKGFSFEQGAAFPLQGMTANYPVNDFLKPKAGNTVVVHAAAGGVGLLCVQWAKHLGATVIATVSTAEKAAASREAGADHVIQYTSQDFAAETKRITGGLGAQLIIDGVGKTTFPGDLEAAAIGGHIVIFGSSSGPADPIVPNSLMAKSLTVSGGTLANYTRTGQDLKRRSREVIRGIQDGWLKLRVGHVFPLAEAAHAHEMLEGRQTIGKVVLTVAE